MFGGVGVGKTVLLMELTHALLHSRYAESLARLQAMI